MVKQDKSNEVVFTQIVTAKMTYPQGTISEIINAYLFQSKTKLLLNSNSFLCTSCKWGHDFGRYFTKRPFQRTLQVTQSDLS